MASPAIRIKDLLLKRPASVDAAHQCLKEKGYARVRVDIANWRRGIDGGLAEAQQLRSFRFPPIQQDPEKAGERILYSPAARLCFQSLFEVATVTFAALASGRDDIPRPLDDAIQSVERVRGKDGSTQSLLFGPNFSGHQPFAHPSLDPFGQTFFNLFNYSNGLLNVHKDRGLVTVIASRQSGERSSVEVGAVSSLWVRSPMDGTWHNLDREAQFIEGEEEVAIFLGEDGEALPFARDLHLRAAEHAVRVDPKGSYVSHSHFRPDPGQAPSISEGNGRVSAAMILRHDF